MQKGCNRMPILEMLSRHGELRIGDLLMLLGRDDLPTTEYALQGLLADGLIAMRTAVKCGSFSGVWYRLIRDYDVNGNALPDWREAQQKEHKNRQHKPKSNGKLE